MFFLQRPHETLWFPRTVMTTEVGWTKVEKFLIWSPLQQGQSKSPLSSRALHRQLMHTKLLHSVSWTGWSSILAHSLQTNSAQSAVSTEVLSSCISLAGPRENFNTVMVLFATLHHLLGSCQDAVAPLANERGVNIWAVVMAQHSKSLGYAVWILLTAKADPIPGYSLSPHTLQIFF